MDVLSFVVIWTNLHQKKRKILTFRQKLAKSLLVLRKTLKMLVFGWLGIFGRFWILGVF
jgi:hypothetical protein